ncbi:MULTISPECIES: antirestriction protein ArdA [Streptomyces]|uniref:antirestriction protein ArdA n=1 Tax=Streptomyces TaxID=1883 RepID=UPI002E290524|nr:MULTISPECIES: antirestriction protein ArdA [Streptomyces]
MSTTTTVRPRAWIGCLACYNAGRLVGDWHDGDVAGLVTPEDLHGRPTTHEEMWVMDHENYCGAITGECSPSHAAEVAEALAELDEGDAEAFAIWMRHWGMYADRDEWVDQFRDAYRGFHRSEAEYAQEWAEEMASPEEVARMNTWPFSEIDWDRAAEVLFADLHAEASAGGVHVFWCE